MMAEIFADDRDFRQRQEFRRRPRFSPAVEIFPGDRDFRQNIRRRRLRCRRAPTFATSIP